MVFMNNPDGSTGGDAKKKVRKRNRGLRHEPAISAAIRQSIAHMGKRQPGPDEKAQSLIYEAWETPRRIDRIALARKAIGIDPDSADAYVILAEDAATSLAETIEFYQQGVLAGERYLGKETFDRDAGSFWGILSTRPYMRAREGLASSLWEAGGRDEAVRHYSDMLRLNSRDAQGIRYILFGCLLELGRDEQLDKLLRENRESSAWWAYTAAALAFKKGGNTAGSRRLLRDSLQLNRHVPDFLLGRKLMPTRMPDSYSPGDENQAIGYVDLCGNGWRNVPGALEWLAKHGSGRRETLKS